MLETRFISSDPGQKGTYMRTATLVIELLDVDADLNLKTDEFRGMFVDAISNFLIIKYVDSVVYRRLLVLTLSRYLKVGNFSVRRRYVVSTNRSNANIYEEDTFNINIERQINWAIEHQGPAQIELTQVRALVKIEEEGSGGSNENLEL